MTIQQDIQATLKQAMREKNRPLLNLVRMLKTKMMEQTTKSGFDGEVDDALWLKVITTYEKSQRKAKTQYEGLGDAGMEALVEITEELELLQRWLPKRATKEETRQWVDDAISQLGNAEGIHQGRLMGLVIKAHKDQVDPQIVKECVAEALAAQ